MRTPPIEARPLTTITGGQSFAELFFTDARVPRSSMLGPLHAGWSVAMTTLSFERAGVARLNRHWPTGSTSCWPTLGQR